MMQSVWSIAFLMDVFVSLSCFGWHWQEAEACGLEVVFIGRHEALDRCT